jgi:hypothetical protein
MYTGEECSNGKEKTLKKDHFSRKINMIARMRNVKNYSS